MAGQDEHYESLTEAMSRRGFLTRAALGATAVALIPHHARATDEQGQQSLKPDFPVADYHVHLSETLTIDKAIALSNARGVKFGIVDHPAPDSTIVDDEALRKYLDMLKKYPVYRGLQPVYPGWSRAFSKELLCQLDYILMDALTLPEKDGGWLPIWREDTVVADKQAFMERYFAFNVRILTEEPIDIFAWPTFLPACISREYDVLWTEERMRKLIDIAVGKDIAIEINEFAQVPKARFITRAKDAGAKFTFGTDSRDQRAGKLEYCLQMTRQCKLTGKNMFTPKPDGQRAVQRIGKA